MKKLTIFLPLFIGLFILSSCSDNTKETTKEIAKGKKDRNMFGNGIPRGLTLNSDGLTDGYIMFSVPNSPSMYLINRKGEVVHEWKGTYGSFQAYMTDDGSIVHGESDPDYPTFGCCGPFGRIQKITWDNKILWDFEYANEDHVLHHDFTVLPNGNILAIAYETMPYENAIAKGRKPENTSKAGQWLEKIVEIEPHGKSGGKIVWEWHLWDHLIQDHDKSKANYGNPADHLELLDFNTGGEKLPPTISQDSVDILISKGMAHRNTTPENMGSETYHFNALKYNPELDQIVISSPALSEILIIDHSTTSKEAASHSGGKRGIGGDFLYRWGNPKNYHHGDSTNQKLFGQHDVRWIENGKPGAGNLTVFNNNINGKINSDSTNYSSVYELLLPRDQKGNYEIEKGKSFGPENPTWKYIASDTLSFYSSFISGAHRMNNGNTFINEGAKGRFFEVTPKGKIVWEYLNPYRGDIHQPNGDPISPMFMTFSEFRATFIPADHPAFANKKLEPLVPQPSVFVIPTPPTKK